VRLGYGHTCAIRVNHALWCWGANGSAQLGLGDTETRRVPTRV
jgi:alpha-tubulin suppressor-like RCC1 family protein